jgi:hypothetical protein
LTPDNTQRILEGKEMLMNVMNQAPALALSSTTPAEREEPLGLRDPLSLIADARGALDVLYAATRDEATIKTLSTIEHAINELEGAVAQNSFGDSAIVRAVQAAAAKQRNGRILVLPQVRADGAPGVSIQVQATPDIPDPVVLFYDPRDPGAPRDVELVANIIEANADALVLARHS